MVFDAERNSVKPSWAESLKVSMEIFFLVQTACGHTGPELWNILWKFRLKFSLIGKVRSCVFFAFGI